MGVESGPPAQDGVVDPVGRRQRNPLANVVFLLGRRKHDHLAARCWPLCQPAEPLSPCVGRVAHDGIKEPLGPWRQAEEVIVDDVRIRQRAASQLHGRRIQLNTPQASLGRPVVR
jgi:hypothetical protein